MFGSKINPSGAASDFGDEISNSILFARADDPGITRTHDTTADSDKKVTISWWQKFTAEGNADSGLYLCFSSSKSSGNSGMSLYFNAGYAEWYFFNAGTIDGILRTNREFRDPIGWTNFVLSIDTTISSPAASRMRMWINGVEETSLTSSSGSPQYPEQNDLVNVLANGTKLVIGEDAGGGYNFDGYLADFIMLDGIAVTDATNFGRFSDSHSSVWVPVNYSGSYGTNGFRLDFAVAPGTGNGAGTDVSGNGRHFTDSNLSASDQVDDTPTKVFPTLNSLEQNSTGVTLTQANLGVSRSSSSQGLVSSTMGMTSGKYYCEVTINDSSNFVVGLVEGALLSTANRYLGQDSNTYGYDAGGQKVTGGSYSSYGTSYTSGDVVGIIFDADNGKLYFSKNGTVQNSGNPVNGTNFAFENLTDGPYFFATSVENVSTANIFNFGQSSFSHTPPTGFVALNSLNLPEAAVDKPGDFFQATKYTGNGSTRSITTDFSPAWVWIKNRSQADEHKLVDIVRGATKELSSDDASTAEQTDSNGVTAFGSSSFSLGSGANGYNDNTENFIAWCWEAGTAFSNDASATSIGTLDSSGRVSDAGHFSIVSYSGNNTDNASFKHGLSAAPELVIHRERDNANGWIVGATAVGYTKMLRLDAPDAETAAAEAFSEVAPNASIITLGTANGTNRAGAMICYAFRSVPGVCKVTTYVGGGSSNPYVHLGFKPRWIMIKSVTTARDWVIFDTARDTSNVSDTRLDASNTGAEFAAALDIDILANGFCLKSSDIDGNASGVTYLVLSMAEAAIGSNAPFPTAR